MIATHNLFPSAIYTPCHRKCQLKIAKWQFLSAGFCCGISGQEYILISHPLHKTMHIIVFYYTREYREREGENKLKIIKHQFYN
jgi:hypothetical protein